MSTPEPARPGPIEQSQGPSRAHRHRWRRIVMACVLIAPFTGLCLAVSIRHDLWADELFSLAMATGHSLEHPAEAANPSFGDYVELPDAGPPAAYSRYLEHERPAAGPGRVVRAVEMSDTSPPLYYLALSFWTRAAGTSDLALRLFSILWAIASIPLIGIIARRIGGHRAVVPAMVLFAFAPRSIYYATEGRMYSMLVFLTLLTALLVLELRRKGPTWGLLALWIAVSVAGMMTHYFFAFAWAGCFCWLIARSGWPERGRLIGAALVAAACVVPWYVRIPEILAAWRVTGGWLEVPQRKAPLRNVIRIIAHSLIAKGGMTCGNLLTLAVLAPLALVLLRKGGHWSRGHRSLAWLWLAAPLLGLAAFDLLRGTGTLSEPRYAITGMPALYLLIASGMARLRRGVRIAFLVLLVLAWMPGNARMVQSELRDALEPFGTIGTMLAEEAGPDDLVIVHSIPSGVAGIARAIEAADGPGQGVALASWVGQLGQRRVPEDIAALVEGRRRVFLVKIHQVGAPSPQEDWLREHARLVETRRMWAASVLEFEWTHPVSFPNEDEPPAPPRESSPIQGPER